MRNPLARLWHAIPEWLFRIAGAGIFFSFVVLRILDYRRLGPGLGYYYTLPDRRVIELPFVQPLIDATFLTIAWGYCVRRAPHGRATGFSQVVLPFIAAFWPMLPFWLSGLLRRLATFESIGAWFAQPAIDLRQLMLPGPLGLGAYVFGCLLIAGGSALDIWSYIALRRSVSIVAEARELVTTGPYRWVRHPVYLGQIISQAGVWLVLRESRTVWIVFYVAFVAMQLFRARVEEQVLARTFGEQFERWRARTTWPF